MKYSGYFGALIAVFATFSVQASTVLFSEDFESGLGQWNPVGTGVVVADPANPLSGNDVLSFTGLGSGGDIFTAGSFFAPSQIYTVSFDYLSVETPGSATTDLGGFVGISDGKPGSHTWIAGTQAGYPGLSVVLTHSGAWTNYSITIDANTALFVYGGTPMNGMPLHLMLEDFVGSDAIAGNVYFDDIVVTAVPEPETYVMLLVGLGLLGFTARYRRHNCKQA